MSVEVKSSVFLLFFLFSLRHQPIPQSYKIITKEYRWAAGDWWFMLLLLLSALVKLKQLHFFIELFS